MSELLDEAGKQLGARPCPGGFIVERGAMQLVASLRDGALVLDLQGSKRAGPPAAASGYRAAASPAVTPLEVGTIEPILVRPLETTDMLGVVPGARRIEIGDDAYDVSTAIETAADGSVARTILTLPSVRKGVFHLLDRGFCPVELYRDRSVVRALRTGLTPVMLEPGPMRSAVDAVLSIGDELPVLRPRREGRLGWRRHWSGVAWFVIPVMLLAGLVAMKLRWSTLEPWELIGVAAGAAVWGMLIPVILILHARRADPIRSAARVLVPCLFIFPLAGVDALLLVNCGLDRSPMLTTRSAVSRMYTRSGDSPTYLVKFPSRRSPEVTRETSVEQEFYEELQRIPEDKRALEIDYYPGRLGLEYYTGMRIAR